MADYHAVLKRAIDALPENTGAARRAVYQRARQAIVNQLKSYEPPLSPSDITTEQLRLEEAIRKVEADAARASLGLGPASRAPLHPPAQPPRSQEPDHADGHPPAAEGAGAKPAGDPAVDPGGESAHAPTASAKPTGPSASAAPYAPTASTPTETAGSTAAHDAAGVASRSREDITASSDSAEPATASAGSGPEGDPDLPDLDKPELGAPDPIRPEPLKPASGKPAPGKPENGKPEQGKSEQGAAAGASGPDGARTRDAIADIDAMTRGGAAPMADDMSPYGAPTRSSRLPAIAAAVAAFIVFVALVAVVYTQRDSILAMFETSDTPQVAETGTPGGADTGTTDSGKDTARLLNDDGSPAAPDARAVTTTRVVPPEEENGVTVAPQDGETEVVETPEPEPSPADEPAREQAQDTAQAEQGEEAAPQATPVAQRAILYEESADASSGGSAEQGRVIWSTAREAPADGGRTDTVVKAAITIPGRDVKVNLTIRPNQDDTLPASHLIELAFDLPDDFSGKAVSSVPGLIMKTTEEARGDALIGASVRVADGFFWVALSSIEDERKRNMALLRDRGWIDIPVLYESGKRAILTLEKGSPGERVVQTALGAWAKE